MKETLNKVRYFLPAEKMQSNLAIFLSIFALFFAVGNSNVPCLSADTCAVGSDEVFSGTLTIQNNTNYGVKLTGNPTANRTITFPDADGTVKLAGATLPASKVMATDVSGNETTTDVYPLSLTSSSPLKTDALGNVTASDLNPETDLTIGTGLANQVLGVNSLATSLTFTSITGVPTLTADKFVITDGLGALTTTSLIPMSFGANKPIVSDASGNLTDVTLTADTPMKTDANGNTSASDLDITTDITAGTSLQQIRTNAGGTALEFFTPSTSGGRWSLVANGTAQYEQSYGSGTAIVCWYDNTQGSGISGGYPDQTKKYKLVLKSTVPPRTNINTSDPISNNASPKFYFTNNAGYCTTNATSYYGGSDDVDGGAFNTFGWQSNNQSYYYSQQHIPYQQGTTNNQTGSGSQCGYANVDIEFENGYPITSSNSTNDGVKYKFDSSAQCYQGGIPTSGQVSVGGGVLTANSSTFAGANLGSISGFSFVHYGSTSSTYPPDWYLYESSY